MADDLRYKAIERIGEIAAIVIIPLGWLFWDFMTAVGILIIFNLIVAEIIFIACLASRLGDKKENWLGGIIIPLVLAVFVYSFIFM